MSGQRRGVGTETSPARARFYRTRFNARGNRIIELGPIVAVPEGPRSPESDRERLAHLSATVFDYNGVAAHVADGEPRRGSGLHRSARPGFKRPVPRKDITRQRSSFLDESGPMPAGWGCPVELARVPDSTIEAAERNAERDLARKPKLLPVKTMGDYRMNVLAYLTPLARLRYLRRMHEA